MSKKNTAPAKKLNLGAIIPAALLLIGLVIMTVCFFNVNSQLNETRAALADAQTHVAAQEGTDATVGADTADVVVDDAEVIAALEAELAAANDAIAALEAELAAANATIVEKDELLTLANDAISQATAALEAIYGTAAEEVVEEPAEVVEEAAEVAEEPAEVVEEPAEVVEEPAEVAEEAAEVVEEPAE